MVRRGEIVFDGCQLHKLAKAAKWDEMFQQATADPTQLLVRNQFHATPFHYALRYGAPTATVLQLLQVMDRRALFMKTDEGELPIHTACQFGISVTAMLAMIRLEPDQLTKQTKMEHLTPLQVAQKSQCWPVGLTWHFYRNDYSRVVAILEHQGAREAMWEAQRAAGHEPVSTAEPQGKDVWQDEAVAETAAARQNEELRQLLTKMDLPEVFVGVPLDPNVRAAVEAGGLY